MMSHARKQAIETIQRQRAQCTTKGQRQIFDSLVRYEEVQNWVEVGWQGRRGDAANLPFAARQLEYVFTEVVTQPYPALAFADQANALVKWNTQVPAGAKHFVYRVQDATTAAAFIATLATGSLPRPALRGAEVQGRLQVMAEEYGYTTDEMRTAAFVGENLDATYAREVARGHAILLNRTAAWGREDLGLPGFLNHPYITVGPAATKTAGGTSWDNATAGEMFADVVGFVHGIENDSRGIYKPNVVALPGPKLRLLQTTRISEGTSTDSGTTFVMELLQKALPNVTFKECNDLEAANSLGNLDEDAMIAFNDSPEYVELVVALWLEQHPVQMRGLEFVVPTESKIGGIKCPHPLSISRLDGI